MVCDCEVADKPKYIKTPFWDSLHIGRIESFKPLELSYVRTMNKTFFDYEIKEGRRFVKKTKIVEGRIKFRPTIHNLYCWVKEYKPEV